MFHETTALTACCDRCRTDPEPWGGEAHFANRRTATAWLVGAGWRVLPGDLLMCADCVCEAHGHDWSPWYHCNCTHRECRCHTDLADRDYRVCARCAALDERPHTADTVDTGKPTR